jgi:hypothetical protein
MAKRAKRDVTDLSGASVVKKRFEPWSTQILGRALKKYISETPPPRQLVPCSYSYDRYVEGEISDEMERFGRFERKAIDSDVFSHAVAFGSEVRVSGERSRIDFVLYRDENRALTNADFVEAKINNKVGADQAMRYSRQCRRLHYLVTFGNANEGDPGAIGGLLWAGETATDGLRPFNIFLWEDLLRWLDSTAEVEAERDEFLNVMTQVNGELATHLKEEARLGRIPEYARKAFSSEPRLADLYMCIEHEIPTL